MSNESFRAAGLSVLVAASSSTSAAPTQVVLNNGLPTVYVANPSTVPVYIAFGTSSVTAGCPTTAVPCAGLCLPSGQGQAFNAGPAVLTSWLSAVTSAGSASIFATAGTGQ